MKIRFCEHNKGKGKVYPPPRRGVSRPEHQDQGVRQAVRQPAANMPMAIVDKKKVTGKDGDRSVCQDLELISKKAEEK